MQRAGEKQRWQQGLEPCTIPRWDSWTNGIVGGAGLGTGKVLEVDTVTSHPHSTEGSISAISKADYWQEKHI